MQWKIPLNNWNQWHWNIFEAFWHLLWYWYLYVNVCRLSLKYSFDLIKFEDNAVKLVYFDFVKFFNFNFVVFFWQINSTWILFFECWCCCCCCWWFYFIILEKYFVVFFFVWYVLVDLVRWNIKLAHKFSFCK